MSERFCKKCGTFTEHYKTKNQCIICTRNWYRADAQKRRDLGLQSHNLVSADKLRRQVYEMYGAQCACCGEKNLLFLQLDHVNNDGQDDRKQYKNGRRNLNNYGVFKKALKEPYRFQILCANCNSGKARNKGICPHKTPDVIPMWWISDLIYG